VEASAAQLRALSPRATLERGYAIVRSDERLVREPPAPGSDLEVEVARGAFAARVH
jgi:exodeoxyribonuclease VII large subunit